MTSDEAVICRIRELCKTHNLDIKNLANNAGMPPSTIYSIMAGKSKSPGASSISKICNGFDISLRDFYDCTLFDEVESEIY